QPHRADHPLAQPRRVEEAHGLARRVVAQRRVHRHRRRGEAAGPPAWNARVEMITVAASARNTDRTQGAGRQPPAHVVVTWASEQLRDRIQRTGISLAEALQPTDARARELQPDREAEP